MKRYILTTAAALLFGTLAFAQTGSAPAGDVQAGGPPRHGRHGRMNPEKRFEKMSQKLNLTDDQKAKIKPLFEQERTQAQELRNQQLTADQRHEKMQSIHENTMTQMRAILTPEQQTKLDTMQQKMRERREKHMKHGPGAGPDGAPPKQ